MCMSGRIHGETIAIIAPESHVNLSGQGKTTTDTTVAKGEGGGHDIDKRLKAATEVAGSSGQVCHEQVVSAASIQLNVCILIWIIAFSLWCLQTDGSMQIARSPHQGRQR